MGDLDLAGGVRLDEVRHAERTGDRTQVVVDVGGERVAALDEAADVVGEHRRVTIGIDRDHRHVDPVGVGPEFAQCRAQVGHRGRAHVGAVGVAEVHDEQPAGLGSELEQLTTTAQVGEGDRVDLRDGLNGVADELPCAASTGCEHEDEHECRDGARAPTIHGVGPNSRM